MVTRDRPEQGRALSHRGMRTNPRPDSAPHRPRSLDRPAARRYVASAPPITSLPPSFMKIDSKVRIACLAVSFLSLSWLLILRYPAIASGTSSTSDIVILLLWVGLMLAPILQEVNLFGLQLKRSIESLREQVQNLMFTVQSQTQSVNVHNYPIPPSDDEINERRKEAEQILGAGPGIKSLPGDPSPQDLETNYLFNLRRHIELELKRIDSSRFGMNWDYRRFSLFQSTQRLVQADLLSPGLAAAMRDGYAICGSSTF
jgi:hypothetical protein